MIPVSELMSPVTTTARPDEPLPSVVKRMHINGHSCAVVLNNHQHIVGLITEKILAQLVRPLLHEGRDSTSLCAQDVMSDNPLTISASMPLYQTLLLTREHGVRHLPVTDESGRVLGMVTQTDLIGAYLGILQKLNDLDVENHTLQTQSLQDPLLLIGNRRAMERDFKRAEQAKAAGIDYAVALLDIDYFKDFNDFYGHLAGDQALVDVAGAINRALRIGDCLYRFGGEELLILLRGGTAEGAQAAVERARAAVEALHIAHQHSAFGYLTVSAGLCVEGEHSIKAMLARADQALYRAKAAGRNRVFTPLQQALPATAF